MPKLPWSSWIRPDVRRLDVFESVAVVVGVGVLSFAVVLLVDHVVVPPLTHGDEADDVESAVGAGTGGVAGAGGDAA